MIDIFIQEVLPAVCKLTLYISVGILLGVILEAVGWLRHLAFLARPLTRLARFPDVCGSAFVTAVASPKTAQAMLSSAFVAKKINQRSLILGAVCCTFPSTLLHLKYAGPLLVTMLGLPGLAYVSFVIVMGLLPLCAAILVARMLAGPVARTRDTDNPAPVDAPRSKKGKAPDTLSQWAQTLWIRWRRLMGRVLMVAVPVFTVVAWMNRSGAFKQLAAWMPQSFRAFLPPETLAVIAVQMTNTTNAAAVLRDFVESGALSGVMVFMTLVAGYVLSLPVRTMRRNLPSVLSIFPGRNGVYIVLMSQGTRFLLALTVLAGWVFWQLEGSK